LDISTTPGAGQAVAHAAATSQVWVPAPRFAQELGVCRRTVNRWLQTVPNFPRPRVVNHRLYFERSAIEAWKLSAAIKSAGGAK
jgi:hypothetical protein